MSKYGVVIPVGGGREENLALCLRALAAMTVHPIVVVLVLDGPDVRATWSERPPFPIRPLRLPEQHRPGLEQPRNAGVRALLQNASACTHVWFLDSDILVAPDALSQLRLARERVSEPCIQVCPYEWMGPGQREPQPQLHNDPRWASFYEHDTSYVSRGRLNDGLACFSGNLVWPIGEFIGVGGFWNDLYHGRCEDGELGLRAVAEGVPIQFVREARGWHLDHPRNTALAMQRNARDVPMIDARHPWVQAGGLVVVERDGKRFDQRCPSCRQLISTGEYWAHAAACGAPISGPRVTV